MNENELNSAELKNCWSFKNIKKTVEHLKHCVIEMMDRFLALEGLNDTMQNEV